MKRPSEPAFASQSNEGMTKYDYMYIEILKSLIVPGKNYTSEEINILLITTNKITLRVFES